MSLLVTDPLRYWARNVPDERAIVFDGGDGGDGGDTVTYGELDAWSDNVAGALIDAGVAPGDRVGIVGPNSLEWCAAALGALKAGAVVAAYNHRLLAPELRYLVVDSDPSLVIAAEGHRPRLEEVVAAGRPITIFSLDVVVSLRAAPRRRVPTIAVDPDQAAVIVYTSGTTSHPKGVVFTHRTTFSFIFEWSLMEPAYQRGARMIFVLSLGGAPGLLWAILHMATHAGTVFLETGFEPRTTLRRLVDERITVMMGVPMLFEQVAALPEFAAADLSALSAVTVGGARVPLPTLEAWTAKGVALRQIYGMTELGGSSIGNTREAALTRPASVGRGSMFTEHRVVRPDGTDCDADEPGEIIVRGPSVTPGYWRNPGETAEAMRDGWFHSGDIGAFDGDGYLRVVDRLKDMIISGGYNIAPSEIESLIQTVPGVVEVAVIAVDDATYGETPAAIVGTSGPVDPAAVVALCRANLSGYKVPSYVVLRDEPLPRMPSGKIAKRELRVTYADLRATGTKLR